VAIVRAIPVRVSGPVSVAQADAALQGIPLGLGITPLHVRQIVEEFDGANVVTYEVEIDPVTTARIDLARRLLIENTVRAVGGAAVSTTGLEASSTDAQLGGEFGRMDAARRAAGDPVGFLDGFLADLGRLGSGVKTSLIAIAIIAAIWHLTTQGPKIIQGGKRAAAAL